MIKHMLNVYWQSNLAVIIVVILEKLIIVSGHLIEIISVWWLMLLPTVAMLVAAPINYYEYRKSKR